MWKQEWRISASVLLAAQRERDEARAERDRLREALERLVYRDDEIFWSAASWAAARAALTADLGSTSGGFHTEEPNP